MCVEAEATYQKTRRNGGNVPEVPVREAGEVEKSVRAELAGLKSAESRPGLVAAAIAMAKVLDNRVAVSQHPSAARQLQSVLTDLHKGGAADRSRLAVVRKMSERAS